MVKKIKIDGVTQKGKGIIHFQEDGFVIEPISDKDEEIKVLYSELEENFDDKLITFSFSTKIEEEIKE